MAGPLSLLGLNNGTLYGTQGRKHICGLMDHGYIRNTTCHHLRDLIESHNPEIGCTGLLFCNNILSLTQYVTPYWISHSCKFMRENNLTLKKQPPTFSPKEKRIIHHGRLYGRKLLMGTTCRVEHMTPIPTCYLTIRYPYGGWQDKLCQRLEGKEEFDT